MSAEAKIASPLGWANREMMLHTVAVKHIDRAMVAGNGNRNRHCALRVNDPFAMAFGNFKIVSDYFELPLGHLKERI